jgi:Domain of unknown function (DUF1707)
VSADPPAVRASDTERERTVELLRAHAGEGRLTLEELAQRIETAYASRTREELERMTADLPEAAAAPVPRRRRRATRFSWVAFGELERKGRWRIADRSSLVVTFGNADIDLRNAQIDGDEVTITAFIAFGNADFYVPEGVDVDQGGLAVFGARGEHGSDAAPPPHAPLVRLRVFTMFGNSDLWRIPAGAKGSYRELIAAARNAAKLGAG